MDASEKARSPRLNNKKIYIAIVVSLIVGIVGGYRLAGAPIEPAITAGPVETVEHAHDSVEFWTCSMHPQVRQPQPGLCPICSMDLIPATAATGGSRTFATTPEAVALMNVTTAPVERRFVQANIRVVGTVRYDETRLAYITAWVPGRIERMYADFTGTVVREGDHMVDFYSPELIAAKEELQRARKALDRISESSPAVLRETAEGTLAAVRSKLRRWGLTASQINQAEASGTSSDRITIYAPIGGTVIERSGQEGMYVGTGERIYTIADLSKVWVTLEAYESDLPWLHLGQQVEFTTEAYGSQVFIGTIAFIEPTLDTRTRTVDVRVNVSNEEGRLKPGMFVRAAVRSHMATGGRVMDPGLAGKWISPMHPEIVKDGPGACDICGMDLVSAEELGYVAADAGPDVKPLVIPATAVLRTGERAIVYVETPDTEMPQFEGRVVRLGARAGDYYLVESGLREGERVVVEGNFQIDSALELAAQPSMMSMAAESKNESPLDKLLHLYFALSNALSHDDYGVARAKLDALASGEGVSDISGFAGVLNDAATSESISELRSAFESISRTLVEHIEANDSVFSPIYIAHCPMAFDNEGADWIQETQTIANPYFGEAMFSCGTIQRELTSNNEAPSAHGGHNHDD